MSCNKNMNIDFLIKNIDKNFDYESLTIFMNYNEINKNHNLPWNMIYYLLMIL
jgi:hypothetical protein